jgi:hypothetical protein
MLLLIASKSKLIIIVREDGREEITERKKVDKR